MKILNLGCGNKISDSPDVVNVDWSMYLRLKRTPGISRLAPLVVGAERLERFRSLPGNILVHDLSKGIPFASDSIDAVYHSHMFEHLDRAAVEGFLLEAKRVLKTGGVHRIVVPDLEQLCRDYLAHLVLCESLPAERAAHDAYVAAIIEQSVRKEAFASQQKKGLRRVVENLVLGDARRRGETHQWMYDRVSLADLLRQAGYREVRVQEFNSSLIAKWNGYGLDVDGNGDPYKPGSLYVEAVK